jgi:hypothetical protein
MGMNADPGRCKSPKSRAIAGIGKPKFTAKRVKGVRASVGCVTQEKPWVTQWKSLGDPVEISA